MRDPTYQNGDGRSIPKAVSTFPETNYTQVPHVFFDVIMPMLGGAAIQVWLAIYRQTYGWHIASEQMSITRLKELTGLSHQSVINGTQELEQFELGSLLMVTKGPRNSRVKNEYALNVELLEKIDQSKNLTSQKNRPSLVKKFDSTLVKKVDSLKETKTKERKHTVDADRVDDAVSPEVDESQADDEQKLLARGVPYQDYQDRDWLVQPELVPVLDHFADLFLADTGQEYEFAEGDFDVLWGLLLDESEIAGTLEGAACALEHELLSFAVDADSSNDEPDVRPFPGMSVAGFAKWFGIRRQQLETTGRVIDESKGMKGLEFLRPEELPSAQEAYKRWKRDFIACCIPMDLRNETFLQDCVDRLEWTRAALADPAAVQPWPPRHVTLDDRTETETSPQVEAQEPLPEQTDARSMDGMGARPPSMPARPTIPWSVLDHYDQSAPAAG